MNNRRNAYTEVYTILQQLNDEEYNKIPPEIIEAIKNNRNVEYEYYLDEDVELKEQSMLPQTKAILFNIFRDYLSTPEQKEKIIIMQNEERQKIEIRKQQQYSTDVFERKKEEESRQIEIENVQLIQYKESIFKKILNKIIKFFTRK